MFKLVKKIQRVGNSKGILIDKRILNDLKNPNAFELKSHSQGILLIPVQANKSNKE